MTRYLFTLNDAPYGTERSFNALRLAGNLAKREEQAEIRVFLVGDAAACAKAGHALPKGYYNIELMLKSLVRRGGTVGACGTCMDARGMTDDELADGVHRSTLDEWTDWAAWADKTLVF